MSHKEEDFEQLEGQLARREVALERRMNEIRWLSTEVERLEAINTDLLAALEGLKCWDCEYPLKQSDYAGCYSCKNARAAIAKVTKGA